MLYTLAEFIFDKFSSTLVDELGFSVDGLWNYFYNSHTNAIRGVHVEQDHALNNIRCAHLATLSVYSSSNFNLQEMADWLLRLFC